MLFERSQVYDSNYKCPKKPNLQKEKVYLIVIVWAGGGNGKCLQMNTRYIFRREISYSRNMLMVAELYKFFLIMKLYLSLKKSELFVYKSYFFKATEK